MILKNKELIKYKAKQLKSFLNENGFKETKSSDSIFNEYYLELGDFFESEEISEYIAHLMYLKRYSDKVDLGKLIFIFNI